MNGAVQAGNILCLLVSLRLAALGAVVLGFGASCDHGFAPKPLGAVDAVPERATETRQTREASPGAKRAHALRVPGQLPRSGPRRDDPPDCPANLTYHGGPLLQSPRIVAVFWNGDVKPILLANMPQFYADIMQSSWWSWLREYDVVGQSPGTNQAILRGTFAGSFVLSPSLCPAGSGANCPVTDAQLQAEIQSQVALGVLPAPTLDCTGNLETIYMVQFPSNILLTTGIGMSCSSFGGYHDAVTSAGTPFAYAALMDCGCLDPFDCATVTVTQTLETATSTAAHELAEATTDAEPFTGWSNSGVNCTEIADICDENGSFPITVSGRTWQVPELWSNAQQSCVLDGPTPPLCAGLNVTGCQKCSCGDNGVGCTGATGVCETNPTNVLFGACEQCTATSGTCATCQQSAAPADDDVCVGCTPLTACPAGNDCGTAPNGCGGSILCGVCGPQQTCGGGSTPQPNVCGCTPVVTACPPGSECGAVFDGCGGTIPCGDACVAPAICGTGTAATLDTCCTPATACPEAAECGELPDGCGGVVSCGYHCSENATECFGNSCCTLTELSCGGFDCGLFPVGCGVVLDCGTCSSGTCVGHFCMGDGAGGAGGAGSTGGATGAGGTTGSGAGGATTSGGGGVSAGSSASSAGHGGASASASTGASDASSSGSASGAHGSGCACEAAGAPREERTSLAPLLALLALTSSRCWPSRRRSKRRMRTHA